MPPAPRPSAWQPWPRSPQVDPASGPGGSGLKLSGPLSSSQAGRTRGVEVNLLNFLARHFPVHHEFRLTATRILQELVLQVRASAGGSDYADPAGPLSITLLNTSLDVTAVISALEQGCPEDMVAVLVEIYVRVCKPCKCWEEDMMLPVVMPT